MQKLIYTVYLSRVFLNLRIGYRVTFDDTFGVKLHTGALA